MSRALWLPQVLRDAGLVVVEEPGWTTRGSAVFAPRWQLFHHTASHAGANAPSLGIVTGGRPDLAGPLCEILVARDGTCHVVASGRANHAGAGRYPDGTTGNSLSIGWECENSGIGEPWPERQLDAIARGQAAVCRHLGQPASTVIYHRTYAPGRKIDPAGPGIPADVRQWQARVAQHIGLPPLTSTQKLFIWLKAGTLAARRPFLRVGSEKDPAKVPHIKAAQQLLGLPQTGTYGPATVAKVKAFQEFLHIPHRGPAGRLNRRTWQWLYYAAFTKGR